MKIGKFYNKIIISIACCAFVVKLARWMQPLSGLLQLSVGTKMEPRMFIRRKKKKSSNNALRWILSKLCKRSDISCDRFVDWLMTFSKRRSFLILLQQQN